MSCFSAAGINIVDRYHFMQGVPQMSSYYFFLHPISDLSILLVRDVKIKCIHMKFEIGSK